jgi:hypothetical protein
MVVKFELAGITARPAVEAGYEATLHDIPPEKDGSWLEGR